MIAYLIGPRCSGKTTMGKAMASHMNLEFVDLDQKIVEKAGKSIPEIVAADGWEGFRKLESEVLREVTKDNTVIATGGGTVLSAENRTFMTQNGSTAYLKAPSMVLQDRFDKLEDKDQYPSLTGKDPKEEMAEVLKEREPIYEGMANYVIDATPTMDVVLGSLVTAFLQFSILSFLGGGSK